MLRFIFFCCLALMPLMAHAVCDAGYYLQNNECFNCNPEYEAYYCPGDDMRHTCPTTDTDYSQFGYNFIKGTEANWGVGPKASSVKACRNSMTFSDEHGNIFLQEDGFNGTNYWGDSKNWYQAGDGYYLAPYDFTTWKDWYSGVKPCTNAPEHAHYTGAGTPDAPDGSIIDANDCPWACDDGYGNHDGECVPLCGTGMRYIKTDTGIRVNLYPVRYSSPTIAVQHNDTKCYANLAPDIASNAINIEFNGHIFHTTD